MRLLNSSLQRRWAAVWLAGGILTALAASAAFLVADGAGTDSLEGAPRLVRQLFSIGAAVAAALLVAGAAIRAFRIALAEPVRELAAVAEAAVRQPELGRRVERRGDGELGGLADRLNELLSRDQARETEWSRLRNETETELAKRTLAWNEAQGLAKRQREELERIRGNAESREAFFRSVLDGLVGAVHVADSSLKMVLVSGPLNQWRSSLGLPEENLVGRHVSAAFPFAPAALEREYAEVLVTRRALATQETVDLAGRSVATETVKTPVVQEGTVRWIVTQIRDVTEPRQIEERRQQSRTQDAAGRLAAGVAREIDPLLGIVREHLDALLADDDLRPPVRDSLCQVRAASERAADLMRVLRSIGRVGPLNRLTFDLGEVTERSVRRLERAPETGVVLQFAAGAGLPPVSGDPTLVEQAVTHLATHVREGIPDRGRLRVELHLVVFAPEDVSAFTERKAGVFVCLSVAGTGASIEAGKLSGVFEPCLPGSSSGADAGRGLELAMVYGIVKRHEAWAEVESRGGTGRCFRIFWPVADIVSDPATLVRTGALGAVGVNGAASTEILVVEHDPVVRGWICGLLRGAGHRVWAAHGSDEAMALWGLHGTSCRLLVANQAMPGGVGGRELARRLAEDCPGLRVILTGGFGLDHTEHRRPSPADLRYLHKPFHPGDLLRAVQDSLPSASGAAPLGTGPAVLDHNRGAT